MQTGTLDGGAGRDILDGGAGNDIYINVEDGIDTLSDKGGIDRILSTVDFSLSSYSSIEDLTLAGNSAIKRTGNDLDNKITGNTKSNALDGGKGND